MSDTELRDRVARVLLVIFGDLDQRAADISLLATDHRGDCTNEAWSCARCYADEHRKSADSILCEIAAAGYIIAKLEGTVNEQDTPRMKPEPPEDVA